eukprot:Phypoly_transcript_00794.p1 GENE.Phypoly_transcript_00794~~Phypoly_transcript_00794.p1  ORF type:complete len:583 (-),score=108.54 Phypoly_transcript_00794:40-1788(-)
MNINARGAVRIAIVDNNKCKPSKCNLECKKFCPVERIGKECVTVTKQAPAALISEETCIGCGICVRQCPMNAITIINLPHPIEGEITHRYSPNSFMLHRLPRPRRGQVLGIVGSNGTGKSTALKILSGKMIPNFGNFENPTPLTWEEVVTHFRGSELQNYFRLMTSKDLKVSVKPQNIIMGPGEDKIVGEVLATVNERGDMDQIVKDLDLANLMTRTLDTVSGGEAQRFAIAYACLKKADIYLFDEPSNYLDIRQRVKAARVIRSVLTDSNFVTVVEHDLSLLDFLSDVVSILYGFPGAFGVATLPYNVREGINVFLDGYLPASNTRFRTEALDFNVRASTEPVKAKRVNGHFYLDTEITKGDNNAFRLTVEPGDFNPSEIIVLLGENGCGKTTFIKHLLQVASNEEDPSENSQKTPAQTDHGDENSEENPGQTGKGKSPKIPASRLSASYKPQQLAPKFPGTVRQLLEQKIPQALCDPLYVSDVLKALQTERLMGLKVLELSGGELQKVALCLALGKPADIYLLDEPSSFLDSEQRLLAAKVIKRFIMHTKKTAFVVEHDFIMATYLADRVIVYDGVAGVD